MRVAYIILTHHHPRQVLRMVQRIAHPNVDCWIHLDKKYNANVYADVLAQKNVFLVEPREEVKWADYSVVQAMVNSLTAAMRHGGYEYSQFLSGADYPIQPTENFLHYLHLHKGLEFIGNRPLEESMENILRFRRYHFLGLRGGTKRAAEILANHFWFKRKFPFNFIIRKGPQWMALSKKAVAYSLDFIASNPSYIRYMKYTHAPDEFFFQTILYNSSFRVSMRNQIFHYIDWSEKKRNPRTLTMQDKAKIFLSNLFFARKFDVHVDTAILDFIDEHHLHFSQMKLQTPKIQLL